MCSRITRRAASGSRARSASTSRSRTPVRAAHCASVSDFARIVRHIGAVMHVVGAVQDGRLLAVALIEETDDEYVVVVARWLDEDEAQPLRKLMERGGR